jgi:hypothetical protein
VIRDSDALLPPAANEEPEFCDQKKRNRKTVEHVRKRNVGVSKFDVCGCKRRQTEEHVRKRQICVFSYQSRGAPLTLPVGTKYSYNKTSVYIIY